MKSLGLFSAVYLVLSGTLIIEAARIKIHIEKESLVNYRENVYKRQVTDGACADVVLVQRSSLDLPGRLNELNDRVTFYRSQTATANLNMFQDMLVPLANFPDTTLREVFDVLRNNTCLPFFFGGAVRDQFLNSSPNDADVEIDCSIETFFNVCVATWGEQNCGRSRSRPLGHVGVPDSDLENADVASTEITFYAPITQLEYTVNSMAYDLNGNEVIIDLTGTGQMDACNRHIRIPSGDDSLESWNDWLNGTSGSAVFRFWKLRSKGLSAYNSATLQFITNQSMIMIENNPNSFASFYCYNVYGSRYDTSSMTCTATSAVCESGGSKATKYDTALAQDFGDYWTSEIQPNVLPTCGSGNGGVPPLSISPKFMFGLLLVACLVFI